MRVFNRSLFLVICLYLLSPLTAQADEEAELQKRILFDQKKLVVMQNMEFTDEESAAFWPLFERFQEDLFQLNWRAVELIRAYASVYQTLTDEQAEKIVKEYLDIEKERIDLKNAAMKKFAKVLPAKKVFRYLQVENKLEAKARFELAREIPLAK